MILRALVEDLRIVLNLDNTFSTCYINSMNTSTSKDLNEAVVTPLYNHTSAETAYVVDDYPYGRRVRTKIRYWLETDPRKGARFVYQTLKPDTSHWNAPKKSTYSLFGAMYLDQKGHVQWKQVSPFSDAEEFLAFVRDFPGVSSAEIKYMAAAKIKNLNGCLDGSIVFKVNGEVQPWSERDNERHRAELDVWNQISQAVH